MHSAGGLKMIGAGELFSLLSAIVWAAAVILLRKSGETLPPFELNLVKNVFALLLMLPTAALIEGLNIPDYPRRDWVIVLASGYFGIAVADTWYLRALNTMGASRTAITAGLFAPFVMLLSAVFLGERLGPWQIAGFVLVLSGIWLVNWRVRRSEISRADLRRGIFYGVGAVFLMAAGAVMIKNILAEHPFFWTTHWRLAGGVAGMVIYATARMAWPGIKATMRKRHPWAMVLTASFLATYLSMIFWLAGYKYTLASIASVLNQTASAFIVLLAWLVLKEPVGLRKITGLALVLAGVAVVVAN